MGPSENFLHQWFILKKKNRGYFVLRKRPNGGGGSREVWQKNRLFTIYFLATFPQLKIDTPLSNDFFFFIFLINLRLKHFLKGSFQHVSSEPGRCLVKLSSHYEIAKEN